MTAHEREQWLRAMSDDELRVLWKQYRLEATLLRAAGQQLPGQGDRGDEYREVWAANQLTNEHHKGYTHLWGHVFERLRTLAQEDARCDAQATI